MRAASRVPGPLPYFIPKNVMTPSLGPNPAVQVDVEGPLPILPDDTYMLCSDGLSGQVTHEEIGMILGCLPPAEACGVLVDLANLRGGPDNITVIRGAGDGERLATGAAGARPAASRRTARPPRALGVAGVMALVGAGLLRSGHVLPAAASLLIAVLIGGGGMIFRKSGARPAHSTRCARAAPLHRDAVRADANSSTD